MLGEGRGGSSRAKLEFLGDLADAAGPARLPASGHHKLDRDRHLLSQVLGNYFAPVFLKGPHRIRFAS